MVYESSIDFTLDTICPFTYLAKKRLDRALRQVQSNAVRFTVRFRPYQLFNDAPERGEDKYEWYKNTRYQGSEELMQKYIKVMNGYGEADGVQFKFGGTVAGTLNAHRVVQHFQEVKGPEVASKLIDCLYNLYFENEQHPSSRATLLRACTDAGIGEAEAAAFIDDERAGLQEVKGQIREQASNGVDAVPYIVIEGRRRDITLEGAREVGEYVKVLEQVIREAS